jgi:hypothetical protein
MMKKKIHDSRQFLRENAGKKERTTACGGNLEHAARLLNGAIVKNDQRLFLLCMGLLKKGGILRMTASDMAVVFIFLFGLDCALGTAKQVIESARLKDLFPLIKAILSKNGEKRE